LRAIKGSERRQNRSAPWPANGGGVIEPPEAVKKLSMGDIHRFWDFVAALMPTDWTLRPLRDGGIARDLCGPDVPLTF